jgi:hypothetical protein
MTEPVLLGLLVTVHGSDVLVSHRIANGNRRGSLRAGVLDSLRGRPVTLSSLLVAVWARARSGETWRSAETIRAHPRLLEGFSPVSEGAGVALY